MNQEEARKQAEASANYNQQLGITPEIGYEWDAGQVPYWAMRGGGRITVRKTKEGWKVYMKKYTAGEEKILCQFAGHTAAAQIEAKMFALLEVDKFWEMRRQR